MRRREFIAGLGGAVAVPFVARAQQPSVPVVGVLSGLGAETSLAIKPAFVEALRKEGFVIGQNVTFESRFAFGQLERLPGLAADLVGQRVNVIFTGGLDGTTAAKAATATIPIVFSMGEDPVRHGFVVSLNRPGGNATGFINFANQLFSKQLNLLHLVVPNERVIGFLVNSNNSNAGPDTKDAQAAALALGLALRPWAAASERDFEQVFATIAQERIGALLVNTDPFFWGQRERLTELAARHAIPTFYERSLFPEVGGLMSYGTDYNEGYRQCGSYVGRILKGAKPADLPVVQATKFEFVVNLKTAKALGLTVPETLLATADEVIQ
jgi:putative tryptophan/tyrosine transport system substrate-binding protein